MKRASIEVLRGVIVCVGFAGSGAVAMAADDYSRLGRDLTPWGAERAGNADRTIPAWDGGIKAPAGFDPKEGYISPFADEKPLYTITAANYKQYEAKLAAGQIELLKRYPMYKINVYPSHRTQAMPQGQYDAILQESPTIKLSEGGNGVVGRVKSPVPFPFPKSGLEIYQNMVSRYRGLASNKTSVTFPVQTNGNFTPVVMQENIAWRVGLPDVDPNLNYYFIRVYQAPTSVAGEVSLVHEPIDQVKEARKAWVYNPGSRRVLRAPQIGYDSPLGGTDGLATMDDLDGLNGAPDRYDWKLVGKKEAIIAYNNFKLTDRSLKYRDMFGKQNINQDLTRYELHRVYVVEATLKPGARHVYAKRIALFDEDTFQAVHVDNYDSRGELWRVHEVYSSYFYDCPCTWVAGDVQYDLQAGRYVAFSFTNEEKPQDFIQKYKENYFSPDNVKRIAQ